MANILAVNGRWYNVRVPKGGLKREISILDGENTERLMSGGMEFDTIGTYYNYSIDIVRNTEDMSDYDALHQELRDPKNRKKLITIPFDQGTITYEAYISNISDTLENIKNGVNYWDGMSVKFVAVNPNEVA